MSAKYTKPLYYMRPILSYNKDKNEIVERMGSFGTIKFDKRWSFSHVMKEAEWISKHNKSYSNGYIIFLAIDQERIYTNRRMIYFKIPGVKFNSRYERNQIKLVD